MMEHIDWNLLHLKANPFNIIPDKDSEHLIWAGFQETKARLDNVMTTSLTTEASRIILNISRWGGGKTHAAYFYANPTHFPTTNVQHPSPLHLIMTTPKEGNNAPHEFYTKVIEEIKVSSISETIQMMRNCFNSEKEALVQIQQWCHSEDLGRILWLLGDDDEDRAFEASQLLFEHKQKGILKKLRLRRGIESTSDKFMVLSSLFRILSLYGVEGVFEPPRRIFLWLDELESFVYYTTRQYKPFSQGLRELVDNTPSYLTLVLNFSFSEPDDIGTLEIVIGGALLDRVSNKVIFEEPDVEQAVEYVKELLRNFRGEHRDRDSFFPFTEDGLRALFQLWRERTHKPLMPRNINKCCLAALNYANAHHDFHDEKPIDEQFDFVAMMNDMDLLS